MWDDAMDLFVLFMVSLMCVIALGACVESFSRASGLA